MTTMLSIILALMLTMGGSPTVSVSPVNSIVPESGVSKDITGKPRLGEFLKIYPVETKPNVVNPRLVLNLSFQYKKSPLIDLNQAFNMNPYNFFDPFGLVIHEWENLGVYGPASWRPDRPVPYKLFTYDESGAYARFKDSIKIEPVQKPDGKWTIRASFKMTVLIWLTNKSKLEHEKAHIVQYMDLYMRILRKLEYIEETADYKPYETKEAAQAVIDLVAGPDYSNIKDMKINIYPVPSVHDKKTRKRANEIIDETNYFEMEKTTDPPFKVRKFEIVKTWLDIILGIKDEK